MSTHPFRAKGTESEHRVVNQEVGHVSFVLLKKGFLLAKVSLSLSEGFMFDSRNRKQTVQRNLAFLRYSSLRDVEDDI